MQDVHQLQQHERKRSENLAHESDLIAVEGRAASRVAWEGAEGSNKGNEFRTQSTAPGGKALNGDKGKPANAVVDGTLVECCVLAVDGTNIELSKRASRLAAVSAKLLSLCPPVTLSLLAM